MAASNWYLSRNGKVLGPYSQSEIVRMKRDGKLTGEVYVCEDGGDAWIPVDDCDWLNDAPAPDRLAEARREAARESSREDPVTPTPAPRASTRDVKRPPPVGSLARSSGKSSGKAWESSGEQRYPKLRQYLKLLSILADVMFGLGCAGAGLVLVSSLIAAAGLARLGGGIGNGLGLINLLSGIFVSALIVALCYIARIAEKAGIEFVHVFLDIEQNTRDLLDEHRRDT